MKAAVTDGKGRVWIEEVPMPEPGDYQCLCRILACATCTGTDLKHLDNKLPWEQDYPGILGHESVGRVIQTGAKVRNITEGDVFLRPAAVYPGETLGGYHSLWGGFAEYGLVTDTRALSEDNPGAAFNNYTKFQQFIPHDIKIPPADASMLITLKEAASFLRSVGVNKGSAVLILGSGPVAKSMCFFSKLYGAGPVITAGRRNEALEWVKDAGSDFLINTSEEDLAGRVLEITSGGGAALCVDTTGAPGLVIKALETLSPEGKIAPYATYPRSEDDCFKEKTPERFVASGPREDEAHDYLLSLLRNKAVDLKMFYTHTLPFSGISEGFCMVREKKAQKIVFMMEA